MMTRLGHAAFAVACNVVHDLTAAGRMADMDCVFEIEMCRHGGEVVGIMIHVVTVADLCGAAVAAAVVRNDTIAAVEKKQHLRIPVIGRKRPAVTEHDGLTLAPILVKDLNTVLSFDETHVL